jgi:hypothetical protein
MELAAYGFAHEPPIKSYQTGIQPAAFMKHQHHFATVSSKRLVQIQALIKSLHRYIDLLDVDIETEERSAKADRLDDPNYPQPARHLRARRENLLATLELLQGRLETQRR